MKSSYKQLLSDTVVFGVGNALMKLVQFCLMPIYTAYMTTEQYGVGELINNLNELLSSCLACWLFMMRFSVLPWTMMDKEECAFLGLGPDCNIIAHSVGSCVYIFFVSIFNMRGYLPDVFHRRCSLRLCSFHARY